MQKIFIRIAISEKALGLENAKFCGVGTFETSIFEDKVFQNSTFPRKISPPMSIAS